MQPYFEEEKALRFLPRSRLWLWSGKDCQPDPWWVTWERQNDEWASAFKESWSKNCAMLRECWAEKNLLELYLVDRNSHHHFFNKKIIEKARANFSHFCVHDLVTDEIIHQGADYFTSCRNWRKVLVPGYQHQEVTPTRRLITGAAGTSNCPSGIFQKTATSKPATYRYPTDPNRYFLGGSGHNSSILE